VRASIERSIILAAKSMSMPAPEAPHSITSRAPASEAPHSITTAIPRLTIEAIEIVGLDIVPSHRRRMSTGAYVYGGKGGWAGRPVMVGIRAGGITGWGEARPINPFVAETAAGMFTNMRDFYAPLLLGRDAMQIEAAIRACEATLPRNPATLATIDMALHDLVGRALGVPVHALLGGACRSEIPLEWSVSLDEEKVMVAEAVAAVEKHAVQYVCIKIGPLERRALDIRVAEAIRKELPDVQLGVDANTCYDVPSAVRFANRFAESGLAYFEQPVPAAALKDMRRIRDRVTVPLMADESVYSLDDARRVVEHGAADVIAVKWYKCGGLRRCRDVAVVAEAGGLKANCAGTANGSYIEAIAAAHLATTIPNHAFGAEFILGLPSVNEHPIISNRPIDAVNGFCNLPPGPGFGFDVDRKALARYALAHLVVDAAGSRSIAGGAL
jgi:L-alanine-DL-glutamate epimerase-like enolase superfamily enzyme